MSRVTAVIADDEPLVRRGLKRNLSAEGVEVVGEARNGRETVELVLNRRPDLLFLDVQMPEMDGVTALRMIPEKDRPSTVFVTAYDQYALKAFELHAVDYLLKPFDDDRFRAALAHARERRRSTGADITSLLDTLSPKPRYVTRLVAPAHGKLVVVSLDQVDWIEAADNYVRLHTPAGTHLIRETMRSLSARLDPALFARVHRSYTVRIAMIEELRVLPSGDYEVKLKGGRRVPMSRAYRDRFREQIESP
jgi:two-component system LytT family response regulator